MATSYSTNLALTLQGTGDNPGTWGNITNTNLGTLIEQAISGYEVQALTSGTTLTLAITNGASSVARNMYLEFTGNGSTVIVPSNKKLYFVYNNCSSGTITVKVAGQTGVTVANGDKTILVSNGTDVVEAVSGNSLDGITTAAMTALGVNAGDSVTSGVNNTAVGYDAGTNLTSGTSSTFVGYEAGLSATTANFTTAVGYGAARANVLGSSNTALGYLAYYNPVGSFNTALGRGAMQGGASSSVSESVAVGTYALNIVASGTSNTAVGYQAGYDQTSANWSSFFGAYAGQNVTTGGANTFVGYNTGAGVTTGTTNSALGDSAYLTGNYSNSTCLGYDSAVTGSNQVQLGNSGTTAYAYGAVVDRASDIRDKADVQDTNLGLNFIMALRPKMYRWDYREDYRPPKPADDASKEEWAAYDEACKLENLVHDGTHKRVRFHQGLIAQEVKQVMDEMGVDFGGYQDFKIKGGQDRLTIAYGELIAPLIKAIQELKAEFDEYKRTHP